jgi:hypothetical protein
MSADRDDRPAKRTVQWRTQSGLLPATFLAFSLMTVVAFAQNAAGPAAAAEKALAAVARQAIASGCNDPNGPTGALHSARGQLDYLKTVTGIDIQTTANAAIFYIKMAESDIRSCARTPVNFTILDARVSGLEVAVKDEQARDLNAEKARRAAHDCYDAGKNAPDDGSGPIDIFRCQIAIYTQYRAAEELARAKQNLAEAEEIKRQIQAKQAEEKMKAALQ